MRVREWLMSITIAESIKCYECWLKAELGDEIIEKDLKKKHEAMADGPFPFLRATYWRWAEVIPALCQRLETAPRVLAVGDIHLENFGTWRDEDGRLVWGVNDYDEAAEMPYLLDLVRLAASALIASKGQKTEASSIATSIFQGYADGLKKPRPWVLDGTHTETEGTHQWLREQSLVPEAERREFWDNLEKKRAKFVKDPHPPEPQPRYRKALLASLPQGAERPEVWHRRAGLGSLGRPRWVARATWQGGLVVREAKAVLPSAWTRVNQGTSHAIRCMEIASGCYRATDPWYRVADGIAVRRLSPNNRKIEADAGTADPDQDPEIHSPLGLNVLLDPRMLTAMGRELATVHLGTCGSNDATAEHLGQDLKDRRPTWLEQAATRAAGVIRREWEEYRNGALAN
jgi:hypothetical protein